MKSITDRDCSGEIIINTHDKTNDGILSGSRVYRASNIDNRTKDFLFLEY